MKYFIGAISGVFITSIASIMNDNGVDGVYRFLIILALYYIGYGTSKVVKD